VSSRNYVFFAALNGAVKNQDNQNETGAAVALPEILTRREAARFLRMSERHFRNLVAEGVLPEIRAGQRKRLYRKSSLLKALEKGQG
jgi:excisionase family DNA binding protein